MDDRGGPGGRRGTRATMTFDLDVLLTMMPMPGGDVPLVFLDDAAATPVPRRDEPGEEVTALMAACLGGGLDLVTDMRELLVPLVPGWLAEFGGRGTLTVRSPRDDPARPFCRVERLGAPPGWARPRPGWAAWSCSRGPSPSPRTPRPPTRGCGGRRPPACSPPASSATGRGEPRPARVNGSATGPGE